MLTVNFPKGCNKSKEPEKHDPVGVPLICCSSEMQRLTVHRPQTSTTTLPATAQTLPEKPKVEEQLYTVKAPGLPDYEEVIKAAKRA